MNLEKIEKNIVNLINNSENTILLGRDMRINLDGVIATESLGFDMKITTGTLDATKFNIKEKDDVNYGEN